MPPLSSRAEVKTLKDGFWVYYEDKGKRKKRIKFKHSEAAHEFAKAIQEIIRPADIRITESEIDN